MSHLTIKNKPLKAFIVLCSIILILSMNMTVKAETLNEKEPLNQVMDVETYETESIYLELVSSEIKANKDWSGEMVLIYSKTFSETSIQNITNALYDHNQADITEDLIKDYEELLEKIDDKMDGLNGQIDMNQTAQTRDMLSNHIDLIKENPLSTIEMEIQQSMMISEAFDSGFKADFVDYDSSLRSQIISLERLRNLNMQSIIDGLNEIKTDYNDRAILEIEETVESGFLKQFQISLGHDDILVDHMGSNGNELFVLITFEDIRDLHSGIYIGDVDGLLSLKNEDMVNTYTQIEAAYVDHIRALPEQVAALDYLQDIRNKTQEIMTIQLEIDGLNLLKSLNEEIETIAKSDLSEEEMVRELRDSFANLSDELESYKAVTSKIKEDDEAVDKALEVIEAWYVDVDELYEELPTEADVVEVFRSYDIFATQFDQTLPVEIRISIEGNFLQKTLRNGQVDTNNNYLYNAVSSGDSAIRLYEEESGHLAFFKASAMSLKTVKLGIGVYIVLVLLLIVIKREWAKNIIVYSILIAITCIVFYPIVWIVGASFNPSSSLGSVGISPFPQKGTLLQYERLFLTTDYGKWFLNTLKIALSNMVLTVSFAVSSAYIFSRFKFKGKKVGLMTMLIIQIFPSFSAMVAIYTLLANIRFLSFLTGEQSLVNTHLGLILVYVAGQIPYNTWLIKGYFDTLPKSMDEAAKIDGANNLQAFWKIILPLGRPIISFVAVTAFMAPWMDFIIPRLLIQSTEKKTLAVGLFEMINGNSNNNFTMFAAGAVLVAIPITLLYAYFQKYIVKGLSAGAVKG